MISYQVHNFTLVAEGLHNPTIDQSYLTGNLLTIFNTVTILFCCPLLNHLILPCLPSTSMKKRLGLGILLNAVAIAVAAILEFSTFNHDAAHRVLFLIIPALLISVAEALVFITGKLGHIGISNSPIGKHCITVTNLYTYHSHSNKHAHIHILGSLLFVKWQLLTDSQTRYGLGI